MLLESRCLRGPYPAAGKQLAWWVGAPEPAYNFGRIDSARFRSARPDARFLHWLQRRYAIQHVVGLSGASAVHDEARRLGMRVSVYSWRVEALPPPAELREVLGILTSGERVLLHCASGSDRTGYTVAALRVWRDGWSLERAQDEMRRFEHRPERWPEVHTQLRRLLAELAPGALR